MTRTLIQGLTSALSNRMHYFMTRAPFFLTPILCALVVFGCARSTNTNVAVVFTPPTGYDPVWHQNDLGVNLWRKNADHWISLLVIPAHQGDALIGNAGMVSLIGLLKDLRQKGSPRSVTVCGHQSGTLQQIYGTSTTGQKLQGAEVLMKIGVWFYAATYVHPANEPSDPQAEQAIRNVCKNPQSNRSFSSKLPKGY